MYSPDQADIDPRNPANWREPKFRFEIYGPQPQVYVFNNFVAEFTDEDEAAAFVYNTEDYHGFELTVYRLDEETGDRDVVLCAEWDEDFNRYVRA